MKKCFIDLETSGLEPWEDGEDETKKGVIFSAGFVLETGKELQVIITPTIKEWGYASPQALEVNGMTWDFLKEEGYTFSDAVGKVIHWLQKNGVTKDEYVFVAQNASFDRKFLVHFMGEWIDFVNGPDQWIDFIPIYKNIGSRLGLNTFYQNSHHISKELGVPEEPKPHEAIEGARVLKRNYDALKSRAESKSLSWPI